MASDADDMGFEWLLLLSRIGDINGFASEVGGSEYLAVEDESTAVKLGFELRCRI